MGTLQRLRDTLEQFVPANTVDELTKQFKEIAQIVFNGRYVVNGEYEIYPIDIEFYFHDVENEFIVITFDGKPITVDKDTMIWIDDTTGVTRDITAPSGIIGNLPAGMSPFKYRGLENPFSQEYTWVSGIVVREGKYYVTTDITKYGDFASTYKLNLSDYQELEFSLPSAAGYISKLGFDANVPWAIMPTEANGSSEECYCDNFFRPTTFNSSYDYVLRFGGKAVSAGGLLSVSCPTTNNTARGRLA